RAKATRKYGRSSRRSETARHYDVSPRWCWSRFSSPRRDADEGVREHLRVTESTAVADDGLEPFVRTEGDGDDVVIIPVAVWLEREFDPILRSGRKLVFYDPQGSGRSAAGPPGRLTFENEVSTGSSNTACGWAIPRPPRTSKAIRGSTSRSGRRPSNAGNRRCSAISRSSIGVH